MTPFSVRGWPAGASGLAGDFLVLIEDTGPEDQRLLRYEWPDGQVGSVLILRLGDHWLMTATLPTGDVERCEVVDVRHIRA